MVVEKIVFGDGSKGKDGRYLEAECLYAALNVQGGIESHHRVDETSLELFEHHGSVPEYKVLLDSPLTNSFRDSLTPRSPNITVTKSRPLSRERLLREVLRWLQNNPGYSLVIGLLGAREVTDSTRSFRLPEIRLEMVENSGDCLIAATVNEISALHGSYSAGYAKQALLASSLMI